MSITKRTFLIVCSIISAILLALNAATYLLFRHAITAQLLTSQEALIEANVQLIGVFTQTVDQLVYQYTSDEQLGTLLSRPVGEDELADFNTRIQLGDRVTYHLNAESRLLNNSFSAYLYINPELPVSSLFRPENTIPNVSRVFSGAQAENETWYREALARTGGSTSFSTRTTATCALPANCRAAPTRARIRKTASAFCSGGCPWSAFRSCSRCFPSRRTAVFCF